jgi:hypothetical protein
VSETNISAVGEKTAIISLGMSCQTSEQIKLHIDLLRSITGDQTMEPRSFPFDAVIAPVKSIQKALRSRRRYPRAQDLTYAVKAYWSATNIYYWHHFHQDGEIATGPRLDEFSAAYRRRAKRFANSLASDRRLIFFVSNTQPDLVEKSEQTQTFSPIVKASHMVALRKTIETFVDRPFELILVTTPRRYKRDTHQSGFQVSFQTDLNPETVIDPTGWRGDSAAWTRSISRSIQPRWRYCLRLKIRRLWELIFRRQRRSENVADQHI